MKLFYARGRLGNQIFQYMFLRSIQKNNELLVVYGFQDLLDVFEIENVVDVNPENRLARVFFLKTVKFLFTLISDIKLITSFVVKEERVLTEYSRETAQYSTSKGIIKRLSFVKSGFFQSEKFFRQEHVNTLKIKSKYLDTAAEFLADVPQNSHRVFVHVRRGDYLNYKVYGKSTDLPMRYFREQIEWFEKNRENSFFVFLSDDPDYIKNQFDYIDNKLISVGQHQGADMAIMTMCHSAILSPSSFGWWGSYLMKHRDIVVAPNFWLGFNSKTDFQGKTIPSYCQVVSPSGQE